MTRSQGQELIFDPEVETTARKNRKLAKERKLKAAAGPLVARTEAVSGAEMGDREEPDPTADNPYMWELTGHSEEDPPTPISLPATATHVEIKLALLNVLPKFYGKSNEDPYNFLNEFIKICKVQKRPAGVTEDLFKMVAFPFSMSGAANQWFSSLAPNSVTSWNALKKLFLDYFFPATKTDALRKEISSIKQEYDEPLSTFWLRFRRLVDRCPNHRYTEGQLLQYFYQGSTAANKDLLNTASNGGFSEIRVNEAKEIVKKLINSKKEYDTDEIRILKKVAQTEPSSQDDFKERMDRMERVLSKVVDKVTVASTTAGPREKPCEICGTFGHVTLQCHSTMGEQTVQANAMGDWNERLPKRDSYSATYNPGWRDHPNFRWRDPGNPVQQPYVPPHRAPPPPYSHNPPPPQGKSMDDKLDMMMGMLQTQIQSSKKTEATLEEHTRQISQLSNSMNELRMKQPGLPSQVQLNPRETANQITLRSGKDLEPLPPKTAAKGAKKQSEQSAGGPRLAKQGLTTETESEVQGHFDRTKESNPRLSQNDPPVKILPPFPRSLARKKDDSVDFLSIFGKMEINLPFLQAIRLPPVSKFLKDFIAGKPKDSSKVIMGESVSAVIQRDLPQKCKDPGMFSLPCFIGDVKIDSAMCDLGASINVMPLSVYNSLNGAEMVKTRVIIQLADRSCVYPEGLLENVLVRVHDFVYPADFYVVKMNHASGTGTSGILLGRPFLRTANTIINVGKGTICLDYYGEKYTFSIDDAMKKPIDAENIYAIDVIDPLVQEYLETEFLQDEIEIPLPTGPNNVKVQDMSDKEIKWLCSIYSDEEANRTDTDLQSAKQRLSESEIKYDKPVPSDISPPILELKDPG